MSRLEVLNPNVTVTADTDRPEDKSDEYFSQFDIICATSCTTAILVSVCVPCESLYRRVCVCGWCVVCYCDLVYIAPSYDWMNSLVPVVSSSSVETSGVAMVTALLT